MRRAPCCWYLKCQYAGRHVQILWLVLFSLWFRASLIYINNCFQRDAKQSSLFIILQVHPTCLECQTHPSSGVLKTVTTTSGIVQLPPSNVAKLGLATLEGGNCTKIWPVPDVVVTVLCTPDDGCGWHPKHVEWTAWSCWREVAAQKIWPVPKAVVTVLCTPDDGCGWHPKHVEWTA